MIKSNLIFPSDVSYPCLMESRANSEPYVVVLFKKEGEGMIVHSSNQADTWNTIGYSSVDFEMRLFQPFIGKLELKGEL